MSQGTTVTYRDDGTKVTVTIEGNVRTTVYEKDGVIRRERFIMASDDEPPPTRRNPWGPPPSSHSIRLTSTSTPAESYQRRVITIPAPELPSAPTRTSSSSSSSSSDVGAREAAVRSSAFNTLRTDESAVPVRRQGSSAVLPAAADAPAKPVGASFNAYSYSSPPLSRSGGGVAAAPSLSSTPPVVTAAPQVLVPPFEAVGVQDFDVAPVVKGEEYLIVDVNEAGTRFAVRGADGRLGWFPAKMVRPLPLQLPTAPAYAAPPQPLHTPISLQPVTFSLGPPGTGISTGAPVNVGFLEPAPLAEARYTTIATPSAAAKSVSIEDIAALVDIDATLPPQKRRGPPPKPAQQHNLYKPAPLPTPAHAPSHPNTFKAIRPLGHGYQLSGTAAPQQEVGRYDGELFAAEAEVGPVHVDMTATIAPPSLPPPPPPDEFAQQTFDPFGGVSLHEFGGKPGTPTPATQLRVPLAQRQSQRTLTQLAPPAKPAELMSFDEIDASLAAISQQYNLTPLPAVDTSGNAQPVTFDEIDASLALIAQELEQPIGTTRKRPATYTDVGEISIIDLEGGLIMDNDEVDTMIMEEELAKGFSELQSLAKEAELESLAIQERERAASHNQHGWQGSKRW